MLWDVRMAVTIGNGRDTRGAIIAGKVLFLDLGVGFLHVFSL